METVDEEDEDDAAVVGGSGGFTALDTVPTAADDDAADDAAAPFPAGAMAGAGKVEAEAKPFATLPFVFTVEAGWVIVCAIRIALGHAVGVWNLVAKVPNSRCSAGA